MSETSFQMEPVESTNIAARGYDPETQTLRIELKGGGVYDYPDFTPQEYEDFKSSPSAGKFFFSKIKGKLFKKIK
ncbi:KTSC domain-containing protein [Candidatus Manganitrophus noduliformans]|uniref:KTSC domain-containing protein n=1 Tax=Candidatus Manganitrophus noduliformans TaxID=2606439 RepID=A0A7X6DMD1_9BACT|nr:KTSC domain-containing protein [Candidatus Manganitrophus noduliformans]NKE69845.1 KTSC domain-containing protein [Candidatus Manganitrophus noduliformans]